MPGPFLDNVSAATQDGPTEISYPFLNSPIKDCATVQFRQRMVGTPTQYVPLTALSTWPGDGVFSANANVYLFTESAPQDSGGFYRWERLWGSIPGPQTSPVMSRYVNLPMPENQFGNVDSLSVTDLDSSQPTGSGYYQSGTLWVSGPGSLFQSLPIEALIAGRATGGTFTITYDGDTTGAIAWDADDATIQAAIEGLASVTADGITIGSGNNLGTFGVLAIASTFAAVPLGWPKAFTMNAAGLTLTTSANPVTFNITGNLQSIYLPDHATITGHGFNANVSLAAVTGAASCLVCAAGKWGVVDADTIRLPTSGGGPNAYRFAGDYKRQYFPTTKLCRMKTVDTYYLPGVTPGITTDEDIVVPAGLESADALLAALVSQTGFQNYASDGPKQYAPGGPLLVVSVERINLDDV